MLKASICVLFFLGTQAYYLPLWMSSGHVQSFVHANFKEGIPIQVFHENPLYRKDVEDFIRVLKSQEPDEKSKDRKGVMIYDGYGNIRIM